MFTSTPSMSMSLTRACESKLTRSSGNGGPCQRTSHGVPPSLRPREIDSAGGYPIARAEQPIEVGALADAVARHAALGRRAPDQRAERREAALVGGREVRLDRFGGFDDVRVGVEDPVAGACHKRVLLATLLSSQSAGSIR